jgi:CspA family cold shock protein
LEGLIARLVSDKGFGFIQQAGDPLDYFFHRSAVVGAQFDNLVEGQPVSFTTEPSMKGPRCRSVTVRPIEARR